MSDEKKNPEKCNYCNSTNIVFNIWGRSEFWSCKDCKKEVTYTEKNLNDFKWTSWDPKLYGFGNSDLKIPLPSGGVSSENPDPIFPGFPSIANNYNDSLPDDEYDF